MANFLLSGLVGLRDLNELMIYVDPFERRGAKLHNLKPLREAIGLHFGGSGRESFGWKVLPHTLEQHERH